MWVFIQGIEAWAFCAALGGSRVLQRSSRTDGSTAPTAAAALAAAAPHGSIDRSNGFKHSSCAHRCTSNCTSPKGLNLHWTESTSFLFDSLGLLGSPRFYSVHSVCVYSAYSIYFDCEIHTPLIAICENSDVFRIRLGSGSTTRSFARSSSSYSISHRKLLATEYNRIDGYCADCADSSSATRINRSIHSKSQRQFLCAVRSAQFTRTRTRFTGLRHVLSHGLLLHGLFLAFGSLEPTVYCRKI